MRRPFTLSAFGHVFTRASPTIRHGVVRIYAILIALNVAGWVLAFVAFAHRPILLGTALLAYTFGLRHAVDADHISAIDNVTRKLMQEGRRPVAVGFFFSLGHSTIVVALSIAIAIAADGIRHNLPGLQNAGGLIGTGISAVFLFLVAAINAIVLADVLRAFREVRRTGVYNEHVVDGILERRGFVGRFFRPLFRLVDRSWKMYPIGVLFGLGFDTATEIGLLGIAAVEAGKGLPVYDILIFPLLFTAGMSLLDTTDGVLMLAAYGWAFVKPARKLYYNVTVTFVSVLVATVVGGIELLNVLSQHLQLSGGIWSAVDNLGDHFGLLGFGIVAVFIAAWIASTLVYRFTRYDELDAGAPPAIAREPAT